MRRRGLTLLALTAGREFHPALKELSFKAPEEPVFRIRPGGPQKRRPPCTRPQRVVSRSPWDNAHMSHPDILKRYAHVILHVGAGLKPGQRLVLRATLESADLVREVVRAAYEHGSPFLNVLWSDDAVTLARFESAPEGSFSEVPFGAADAMEGMAARGDAVVSIL